ncbi:YesL family protein [Alkalihalobacillus sp. 1P02AB]|uniref:YesL family protein n=1 Tax=Alkalihalobacillus sp. 1P02AB TaxID=3132260 RepID=UPI0039A669BB
MGLTGIWSKLFSLSEWLMKILYVNGLWLLFNLPLVYLLANIVLAPTFESLSVLLISFVVLLPFIFFPATTAMFSVVRTFVMKTEQSIFRTFWKGFKGNYIRSLIGGVFFSALWSLWIYNYYLAQIEWQSPLFYFYLVTTVFLISWNAHFFSDTVHFNVKFFTSIKKSILLAVGYLPYTISMVGVSSFSIYTLNSFHPLFAFFLSGGVFALVCFFAYYQIIKRAIKIQEKIKKQQEQEAS